MKKPTKLDKDVGSSISLHRKIKNKTRGQLAEKIGVSYEQIYNYETGRNQLTLNRLKEISDALKVTFGKFLPQELIDPRVKIPRRRKVTVEKTEFGTDK